MGGWLAIVRVLDYTYPSVLIVGLTVFTYMAFRVTE